jgi:hypothetical protein
MVSQDYPQRNENEDGDTDHTQGAKNCARIILGDNSRVATTYGEKPEEGIADLIDRMTHLPELIKACEWASRQEHHRNCGTRKHSMTCDCFVDACREVVKKSKQPTT